MWSEFGFGFGVLSNPHLFLTTPVVARSSQQLYLAPFIHTQQPHLYLLSAACIPTSDSRFTSTIGFLIFPFSGTRSPYCILSPVRTRSRSKLKSFELTIRHPTSNISWGQDTRTIIEYRAEWQAWNLPSWIRTFVSFLRSTPWKKPVRFIEWSIMKLNGRRRSSVHSWGTTQEHLLSLTFKPKFWLLNWVNS